MEGNKMVLSFGQFDTKVKHIFKQLWKNKDLADVTLVTVDGQQIRAHKVILSSWSSFFKSMLTGDSNYNIALYIENVRYKELYMIIKLIYLDQCYMNQRDLENVLAAGKYLKIDGLMEDMGDKSC